MSDDLVELKLRLQGAREVAGEANAAGRAVGKLGTEAEHASRKAASGASSWQLFGRHMNVVGESSRLGAGSLRQMAGAAVAMGAGFAAISKAKDAVAVTGDLAHTTMLLHRGTGLSTEDASRWAAAANVRHLATNKLAIAFRSLSTAQGTMAAGGTKSVAMMHALGVSTGDVARGGKDFHFWLDRISRGLHDMPAGPAKLTLANKLLGRSWKDLLPLFNGGTKAMEAQLHIADRAGLVLHGNVTARYHELVAAQRELKYQTLGIKVAFGTALMPVLTKASQLFARLVGDIRAKKWTDFSQAITAAGDRIGGMIGKLAPKLANGMAHAAPAVLGGLIHGFTHASLGGQAVMGLLIMKKLGFTSGMGSRVGGSIAGGVGKGLGKLASLAAGAVKSFGLWFIGKATAQGALAGAAEGQAMAGGRGLMSGGVKSLFGSAARSLGLAMVPVIGPVLAIGIAGFLNSTPWDQKLNIKGVANDMRSQIVAGINAERRTGIPGAGAIGGHRAGGGPISWSGLTLVGERGPELVSLPRGSYVHSNAESRKMAVPPAVVPLSAGRVSGHAPDIVVHSQTVMADGRVLAEAVTRHTKDQQNRR